MSIRQLREAVEAIHLDTVDDASLDSLRFMLSHDTFSEIHDLIESKPLAVREYREEQKIRTSALVLAKEESKKECEADEDEH